MTHLPYTLVSFLEDGDLRRFTEAVAGFPKSLVVQLPPHLTILGKIFPVGSEDDVIRTIGDVVDDLKSSAIEITTAEPIKWFNMCDGGYIIALKVIPSRKLFYLRKALQSALLKFAIPQQESIWYDYDPHLTVSLAAPLAEDPSTSNYPTPESMHFSLWNIELLRPNGNFFSYTRLVRFAFSKATR